MVPPSKPSRRHDLVIVANRLPVRRSSKGQWQLSPGGLVSALIPIVTRRNGAWIGWSGNAGAAPGPFEFQDFHLHPIPISRRELEDFYYGFSNGTLWPLYHDAIRWPEYHRHWWGAYREINHRFAEAAAAVAARGARVWVHDYHLQLVPRLLRGMRPDLRIGFFLHVPFPPQELFAQLPWRREILKGVLGSDVVGFQTDTAANNFARLARRFTGATGPRHRMTCGDRTVRLDAFPVSIDVDHFETLAGTDGVARARARLRAQLRNRRVILGVDRLDYTKGIDIRAFQELLSRKEISARDYVFVQTAVPSRERVATYMDLKQRIEMMVGQINGEYGEVGTTPVHYLHRNLAIEELVALYRLADVMVVTPFRDGMNLVAKEYVACRLDDTGVLLLSEFTGSARELKSAVQVNPHDIDGLSASLLRSLNMPRPEMTRRMKKLRSVVKHHDVFDWGREYLEALDG